MLNVCQVNSFAFALAGDSLVVVTVSLDPSQHLMSNHSLNLTEAWVCFSTSEYEPTADDGGCVSSHSAILQASRLLVSLALNPIPPMSDKIILHRN